MHVSRTAPVVQIPVLPPPFTAPFCINCSPLHPATQASIPKVKQPSLILMLPFSQAICHFHGSPFLCFNLPTSYQFICLGNGNRPTLASHSHFPPALLCSCKVHLILYIALPKTATTAHAPVHLTPAHLMQYTACSTTTATLLPHWFPCPRAFAPPSLSPSPPHTVSGSVLFKSLRRSFLIILV